MAARRTGTNSANALKKPIEVKAEAAGRAPAEAVYDLLADPASHLIWAGERQGSSTRLLTIDAPTAPIGVGDEFATTGADPMGGFSDRSVVTEATPSTAFEFVTEATLTTKKGEVVGLDERPPVRDRARPRTVAASTTRSGSPGSATFPGMLRDLQLAGALGARGSRVELAGEEGVREPDGDGRGTHDRADRDRTRRRGAGAEGGSDAEDVEGPRRRSSSRWRATRARSATLGPTTPWGSSGTRPTPTWPRCSRACPTIVCQCPHWGYVIAGKLTFHTADGDETYTAGDAYYIGPGHTPELFAGTEVVEFHPTAGARQDDGGRREEHGGTGLSQRRRSGTHAACRARSASSDRRTSLHDRL